MQTNLFYQKVSQWLPEEEVITKGARENFRSDGYKHCIDCGDGFMIYTYNRIN